MKPRDTPRSRWVSPLFGALMLLGLGLFATAGYLLGSAAAPSETEAREERLSKFQVARTDAEAHASAAASSKGRRAGVRVGEVSARRDGKARGATEGDAGVESALAAIAEEEAEAAAAEPADGPCGLYAELQPDGSCGPKTPDPATPEECPPGYVPAGIYGACAPGRPGL
jgi:hypothetical protein